MRWMLLAVALVGMGASPALAQKVYGNRTPMHRATYADRGVSPVKYAATTQVQEETAEPVHIGCSSCSAGVDCGCSSARRCPCPPLLPNLMDNVADLFVRFKPCPSKCSPCVRSVHCCPYPKTMPPSFCCKRRLPGLLDSIFVCNKGCCKTGCGGCAEEGCTAGGCTSCAAGAHGSAIPAEILTPPAPPAELKESPFRDDPAEAKRSVNQKTAGTPSHWYKKARPTATYTEEIPDTIIIGSASPIGTGLRE